MVPSIYPLETLHNSLSLKQVNEFLGAVCESAGDQHTRTSRGKENILAQMLNKKEEGKGQ